MKRRLLSILLLIPLSLLGLALLTEIWLMNSDAGSRWMLGRVSESLGGNLTLNTAEGNLDSGLQISGIRFVQDNVEVEMAGLQVTADIALFPLRLEIDSLAVQDLIIRQPATGTGPEDALVSVEDTLASLRLPFTVHMNSVEFKSVDLLDIEDETLLHLDRIYIEGRWGDEIELQRLDLDAPWLDAGIRGHLTLLAPFDHQLLADGEIADTGLTGQADALTNFSFEIAGNSDNTHIQVISQLPEMEISGSVINPLTDAVFDLDFRVVQLTWATDDESLEVGLGELSGALEGKLENYLVTFQTTLEATGLPVVNIELAGRGGMQELVLDSLVVDGDFLQARANGNIAWTEPASIDLDVDLQRLAPTLWFTDFPPEHFIHGQASLKAGQTTLEVKDLSMKMAGTDMEVKGEGVLNPLSGILDGRFSWHGLSWPVGADLHQFSSDSGWLQLTGSPSDWRFEAGLGFDTPSYPGGDFELQGTGGADNGMISILKGEALGGTVAGEATLDWSGPLKWNAELALRQINLGDLFSDWPLQLDTKLSLVQDTGDDLLELRFDKLTGEFEGQHLEGSGGLLLEKSEIRFNNIQLHSGDSHIALDGSLEGPAGLTFTLDVRKPGWMADQLGGQVTGRGRIAPSAQQPVLDLEINAHDLQWGDSRIGDIMISPLPGSPGGDHGFNIQAENLQYAGFSVEKIEAVITGDRDDQMLDIHLEQAGHVLDATLKGAVSDWNSWATSEWSGDLLGFKLVSGQQTLISLQGPAPLAISAAEIYLGQSCFSVADAGGMCVESRWRPDGFLDVTTRMSGLSLDATRLVYEHQLDFTQTLDGEFRWLNEPGKRPSGHAAINISPGQFGDKLEKFDRVDTAAGFFGFEMSNGNLTTGKLDIPFPGVGAVDVDYALAGVALDGTGKVNARIKVGLNDIAVLGELLPATDHISGRLNTVLKVVGRTGDPKLDGFVSLHDATADFPYLGTQFRQVQLEGKFKNDGMATFDGTFMAGDGQGEISLESEFSDWFDPAIKLHLSGTSLRLLNKPDLRLDVDPDVHLDWKSGDWVVGGSVVIQQARIAPVTSYVSQVNESEDIRIIAGTLPNGGVPKATVPFRLSGELEITLGEKVEIDTEQAKLGLKGAVSLTWSGEQIPVASGSIIADGTLSVFGPQLHVSVGQLRFPDVPANSPILDIRAERDIYGNTQIHTAGVSITGSVRRPVIEAYTNPYTNKDRAWALLITGNDVDYGQGVGALEVGTYIAPRLYLSYGVSLFDEENTISARYDLRKGFGVKASSSQRESGIDMSYTIDR